MKFDLYDYSSSIANFREAIRTDQDALKKLGKLVDTGYLHALEMMLGVQRTVHVYGYFKAPVTGIYNFVQSYDDRMEVWVSSVPDSAERNLLR